jgi:hypothetical protein
MTMKCLTYQQCFDWCQAHGYPVTGAGKFGRPAPMVQEKFRYVPLVYPKDSGRKVELSLSIIEAAPKSTELLLWVSDWAVWHGYHHMPLFSRFREAFGERRPLIEAPGHLIAKEDLDDAVSVLATSLLFLLGLSCFFRQRATGLRLFPRRMERNLCSGRITDAWRFADTGALVTGRTVTFKQKFFSEITSLTRCSASLSKRPADRTLSALSTVTLHSRLRGRATLVRCRRPPRHGRQRRIRHQPAGRSHFERRALHDRRRHRQFASPR